MRGFLGFCGLEQASALIESGLTLLKTYEDAVSVEAAAAVGGTSVGAVVGTVVGTCVGVSVLVGAAVADGGTGVEVAAAAVAVGTAVVCWGDAVGAACVGEGADA